MNAYYYFNKLPIYVTDNSCNSKTPTFLKNGKIWEEEMVYYFYSFLHEKSLKNKVNVVDVGAQIGLYSLLAKYLPNTYFYAFEPSKENRDELLKNLKFNEINNVKVFPEALSNKKETTTLQICETHNGLHTLSKNPLRFKKDKSIPVKTDTLDSVFYDHNHKVDVIKMDTEGWEYYILQGGLKTIRKDHPDILMEYYPVNMKQCGVKPEQIDELLKKEGYHLQKITGEERWYTHHSKALVYFDVGSHQGRTCIPFLKAGYKVHAFEPNPELITDYLNPIKKNHSLLTVNELAVDSKDGEKELHITKNDECSSLKEIVYEAKKWDQQNQTELDLVKKIKVKCTRLDTYLMKNKIELIDCLKIDAQGCNLEVLQSLGDYISKCNLIIVETQLKKDDIFYKNESKKEMILKFMKNHPFDLLDTREYPKNLFMDLIFKRNNI